VGTHEAFGRPEDPRVVLERYALEHRIGAGGHGTVWRALDVKLERQVAVKVIPSDGGPARPRAEREARVAARLNHPGIVALYELGRDEHALYLVSELVRGRTMAELEAAGALSDRDVARLGEALCDALAHAHRSGVVHRDVKPQNVIVVAEPAAGAGFCKLTDFGIAHVTGGEALTRTGDVVGTLAYMAPEQAQGGQVTPATDVYALALLLYEALTGVNPLREALARGLHGGPAPAPLGRLRRELPAGLCRAVDRALDPRPERRPPLGELAAALEDAGGRLSEAGGLVERGTLERVGLSRGGAGLVRDRHHPPRLGGAPRALTPALAARAVAGLAAGVLVLAGLTTLGPAPPVSPAAAAAVVAAAVALLPRLGWLMAGAGVCLWLASPGADRAGAALVIAAALAVVPIVLPRAGILWSAAALAPLCGLAGLAPAFAALAGLAGTAWRRLALGAAGLAWIVAAELLAGRALLYGPPARVRPPAAWESSLIATVLDALYPVVTSAALAPGLAFAALAVLLPVAIRGRALVLDAIGTALWAVCAAVALVALGDSLGLGEPRGAVAGAALGALLALAIVRARVRRGAAGPSGLP